MRIGPFTVAVGVGEAQIGALSVDNGVHGMRMNAYRRVAVCLYHGVEIGSAIEETELADVACVERCNGVACGSGGPEHSFGVGIQKQRNVRELETAVCR